MRPTFLGLETARKGLAANQKGLDVTGQNITNVNTPGYTRQRMDLVSVSTSNREARYATSQYALSGQGVCVKGVSQTRDPFLDKRFREEFSDVGYYEQSALILEDIESALDEVSSSGMKDALSNVFKALQDLSKDSDQATHANIVLTASKNLTQILKQFDVKLNNILKQQKFNAEIAVNDVNSIIERVYNLNNAIGGYVSLSGSSTSENYQPNELLDEQNLLLDELSRYADVLVSKNDNGTIMLEINGHIVVDRGYYETMSIVENHDSTISISWQSTGENVNFKTGSLKAYVDMINGAGSNAIGQHQNYEKGIPYYMEKIDIFSRTFANVLNNAIPIIDPITGDAIPNSFKILFEPENLVDMTAGNITVSDEWNSDPSYIIKNVHADGEVDNTHILKLINKFDEDIQFGEFNGTFEEYVNFYNTTIGQQKVFCMSRFSATAAIADDMQNRRDAVSGVSMDEEGANLMMYEKAYNAVARLMTAFDEALDVLINKTGVVGR